MQGVLQGHGPLGGWCLQFSFRLPQALG